MIRASRNWLRLDRTPRTSKPTRSRQHSRRRANCCTGSWEQCCRVAQGRPGFRVAVRKAGFARSFWDVARAFQVTRIKVGCCRDERFVKARRVNPKNFFAELKRRNVYKVAMAYAVAGWALSQGIAQVFPVFDVPNWAIRLIVLLIILGLPIALVLAWMFELTPHGIKRTETADAMPRSRSSLASRTFLRVASKKRRIRYGSTFNWSMCKRTLSSGPRPMIES